MSHCKRPDRDVAELVCGHPLPCPYHTVTLDTTTDPPCVKVPVTNEPALRPKVLETLKDIGRAISEDSP
jgi:hypothetical protein